MINTGSNQLMPMHFINYSTFMGPFESNDQHFYGKIMTKISTKKLWISQERKELFSWKTFFVVLEEFSLGRKIKNSRHKL